MGLNRHPIPRTVIFLGVVSFLTDCSSEMIYPLLPVFLASTLGAPAIAVGIIEGLAETTAALLKLASGLWSDRLPRRKPFLVAGYGIAGLVRPLIGLAGSWPAVLALRVADRIGKGIRSAPRDALIVDVSPPERLGRSFGFHRSMDHAGAVAGPLIASALLLYGLSLRNVFLLAAIPALLTLIVLAGFLKEPVRTAFSTHDSNPTTSPLSPPKPRLSGNLRVLLFSIFVFTLGNSTDAFLLLRLSESGVPAPWLAALWAAHHVVKMAANLWGGILADRIGKKRPLLAGWLLYAMIYLGFGFSLSPSATIALFLLYGLYYGLTEPSEKALVGMLSSADTRGKSYGYYHFAQGFGALPASLLFGWLWHAFNFQTAFVTGAVLAAAASLLLVFVSDKIAPMDTPAEAR